MKCQEMITTQLKRKRMVITLDKKLAIISELRQGKSQRLVSALHSVAKSTVADIWKHREKITLHVTASDDPSYAKKRCIIREPHFEKLDKAF